jgi:poly(3-hydroxybutyrate) depolymerase
MFNRIPCCLIVLISCTLGFSQTINLGGIVSTWSGKPVANAIITLVRQAMKDTTRADGSYSFAKTTAVALRANVPQAGEISIRNGTLQFNLCSPSPVTIELFDAKGTLLNKQAVTNLNAGTHRFDIARYCRSSNLLVIKASIGIHEVLFSYVTFNNTTYTLSRIGTHGSPFGNGPAQATAAIDSLTIIAAGFQTKVVPVTSYENQQLNITLDSAGASTDTGRSAGCGKTLSDLKNGTYTITSASLSREYIIDIPANYNPDKPYRLIFAMHWSGGSMQAVANDKFYSLKPYAENDKAPCIFIAPQGTGSPRGWDMAEKDHTLFDDLYKLATEKLCVDTKRVFSCGFSFGALFTYSLSLSHQKQLRAVACYAPANWNIWFPENTHEPIAFYATTGTNEPNCKFIYDEAKKLGVKYCLLQHSEDNGCTEPANIPLATSKQHVSTEFSGCKPGYPVKFSSFQGQTSYNESDPGSSVNWIAAETWEFFNRF